MKKALAATVMAATAAAEASADTDMTDSGKMSGFYAAVRGYASIEDQNNFHFSNSREVAAAGGWRMSESVRFEAEYAVRWSDISGLNGASGVRGKADVQSLGLHGFYDFRRGRKIRPFVGAGVGVASLNFEFEGPADINPDFIVRGKDRDFSHYFNYFAGASYHIDDHWRIGMGAEYVTLRDDSIDSNLGGIDGINRAYNFFVGVRYFFGGSGH